MGVDEQLVAFLEEQGAIQILLWLVDGPKRFTDLYDRIDIARATLSKRLQHGEELGFWKSTEVTGETSARYELAERGEVIAEFVGETPSLRHLQSLYNTRQDFEEDRKELLQWVRENTDAT